MQIVPCHDLVIVPGVTYFFQQDLIKKIISHDVENDEEVLFLILKEDKEKNKMMPEDFYPIGVKGIIIGKNQENSTGIKAISRIQIDKINIIDGEFQVEFSERADIEDIEEAKGQELIKEVKNELRRFVSVFPWGAVARNYIAKWNTLEEIAASMSYQLTISSEEKYKILETDKISERHERIRKAIYELIEITQIGNAAKKSTDTVPGKDVSGRSY